MVLLIDETIVNHSLSLYFSVFGNQSLNMYSHEDMDNYFNMEILNKLLMTMMELTDEYCDIFFLNLNAGNEFQVFNDTCIIISYDMDPNFIDLAIHLRNEDTFIHVNESEF